jgi:hypothetical protein
MKTFSIWRTCSLVFTVVLFTFLTSCKKNEPDPVLPAPTVQTFAIGNITALSAQGGGTCFGNGSGILEKGLCWSVAPGPTTGSSTTSAGSGEGDFTGTLTGLAPNTEYHVRAYATSSAGTAYGSELTFTTLPGSILTTTKVTDITATTAISGGNILFDGGIPVTARGICWGKAHDPTLADDHSLSGEGMGAFSAGMQDLDPNTRYYVRAFATTGAGTSYGNEVTFDNSIYIGAQYGGGTVFYLDSTWQHGLVAANNNQGSAVEWGCEGVPVPGTLAAIGAGLTNTSLILQKCSTVNAAQNCDALVLNGYSDWFLPSKDELNEMYRQKTVIGGFFNKPYWSSTEYKSEAPYGKLAWFQWFDNGDQSYTLKSNQIAVRAIRAF